MVFAISTVAAVTSRTIATRKISEIHSATVSTFFVVLSPHFTSFTPGQRLAFACTWRWISRPIKGASSPRFGRATQESGSGLDVTCAYSAGYFFCSILNACSFETNVALATRGSRRRRCPTAYSCACVVPLAK